jgi:hypothetical protein
MSKKPAQNAGFCRMMLDRSRVTGRSSSGLHRERERLAASNQTNDVETMKFAAIKCAAVVSPNTVAAAGIVSNAAPLTAQHAVITTFRRERSAMAHANSPNSKQGAPVDAAASDVTAADSVNAYTYTGSATNVRPDPK